MVANERKAKAKLQERVDILEKRGEEKRRRLEQLEGAVVGLQKVRKLLDEDRERERRQVEREIQRLRTLGVDVGGGESNRSSFAGARSEFEGGYAI